MRELQVKLGKSCSDDGLELNIYNCDDKAFEKLCEQLTRRNNKGIEWVSFVGRVILFKE